jgi:hypothetical protein
MAHIQPQMRVRDMPALLLLVLLHLAFTLSSLFLRVYEVLTNAETDLDLDDLSAAAARSPIRTPSRDPPKHVARQNSGLIQDLGQPQTEPEWWSVLSTWPDWQLRRALPR